MSKNGQRIVNWAAVCIAAFWAIRMTVAYLLWNKRPSDSDGAFFLILMLYLWINSRFEEQDERLKEMESRVEELEGKVGD